MSHNLDGFFNRIICTLDAKIVDRNHCNLDEPILIQTEREHNIKARNDQATEIHSTLELRQNFAVQRELILLN